jgi:hypothetical protein
MSTYPIEGNAEVRQKAKIERRVSREKKGLWAEPVRVPDQLQRVYSKWPLAKRSKPCIGNNSDHSKHLATVTVC